MSETSAAKSAATPPLPSACLVSSVGRSGLLTNILDVPLHERLGAILDDPAATDRTRRLAWQALVLFEPESQGRHCGRPPATGAA